VLDEREDHNGNSPDSHFADRSGSSPGDFVLPRQLLNVQAQRRRAMADAFEEGKKAHFKRLRKRFSVE